MRNHRVANFLTCRRRSDRLDDPPRGQADSPSDVFRPSSAPASRREGERLWTGPNFLSAHQAMIGGRARRAQNCRDGYLAYGIGSPDRDSEPRRLIF